MSRLIIPQGTAWARGWPIVDRATNLPVDLTAGGWTAYGSITSMADWENQVEGPTPIHEWSTQLENITFEGNILIVAVLPEDSVEWDFKDARWEIQAKPGSGEKITVDKGVVELARTSIGADAW